MISGDYVTVARWGEHQQLAILWGGCVCVYIGSCSLYFRAPHRIASQRSSAFGRSHSNDGNNRAQKAAQTGAKRDRCGKSIVECSVVKT